MKLISQIMNSRYCPFISFAIYLILLSVFCNIHHLNIYLYSGSSDIIQLGLLSGLLFTIFDYFAKDLMLLIGSALVTLIVTLQLVYLQDQLTLNRVIMIFVLYSFCLMLFAYSRCSDEKNIFIN